MTGDEMERAIEFLLQSQANFELRLEKTNQQIERTERQMERTVRQSELTDQRVSILAETQTEFIQAMLGHVEAQLEINASLRRKTNGLTRAQQQTQKDISDLTKTVGELAKMIYRNGKPKRPRGSNG